MNSKDLASLAHIVAWEVHVRTTLGLHKKDQLTPLLLWPMRHLMMGIKSSSEEMDIEYLILYKVH